MRRLSQFKAISAASSYFGASWSMFRPGMLLLGRQQGQLLLCSMLNPLLLPSQLATVEPGMKFHMYTKEELEEVIKDI